MSKKRKIVCPKNIPGYDPVATAAPGDYYDNERAENACAFFENHITHHKGKWAGKPFALESWQHSFISNLFGWMREDGTRRFRNAYVEIPRKNGKTTMLAAVGLYCLLADGENAPEVVIAASSRDQAAVCGDTARMMVKNSKTLSECVEVMRNTISAKDNNGRLDIISSDANNKHGKSPSCIVLDEVHTFGPAGEELYNALVTGVAARAQPLILSITTAGHDKNSLCWKLHQYADHVRKGIIKDSAFLPVIWGAEKEDDWHDEKVWAKCNPSLNVSVSLEFLRAEHAKAQELTGYSSQFRRLYLNQWTESETRWISAESWNACAVPGLDIESLAGQNLYIGMDLSTTTDLTSIVCIFTDEQERVTAIPFSFCPENGIKRRAKLDRVPYEDWRERGHLEATSGDVVDYDAIINTLQRIAKIAKSIILCGYDPWNATMLATTLQSQGFKMVEVRQGFRTMSEPCRALEALILSGRLMHPQNVVLDWCISNCVLEIDSAGNCKPSKAKSTERIDACSALVTALACMCSKDAENNTPSIYESNDLKWL